MLSVVGLNLKMVQFFMQYIYMLFAGREVRIGKNCDRGLGYRPRAVLKIEGTVFPNTDRTRPANNLFIFFFRRVLCKQFLR